MCLDCELIPWSAKAQGLLRQQYAAAGTASRRSLTDTLTLLQQAQQRGVAVSEQIEHYQQRADLADRYVAAYRRYCWNVEAIADFKLASFHILATAGQVHSHQDHRWHMEQITQICQQDTELLLAAPYRILDLHDPAQIAAGIDWWQALTEAGGEGMVVKSLPFIVNECIFGVLTLESEPVDPRL